MATRSGRLGFLVLVVLLVLCVPLGAMLFTTEVNWGPLDFAIAGALLIGAGLVYEFAVRAIPGAPWRAVLGALLAGVVLVIWAELAVGIL